MCQVTGHARDYIRIAGEMRGADYIRDAPVHVRCALHIARWLLGQAPKTAKSRSLMAQRRKAGIPAAATAADNPSDNFPGACSGVCLCRLGPAM